jgi:hypothetical protein
MKMMRTNPNSVGPEPLKPSALSLSKGRPYFSGGKRKELAFDKLRPDG